MSEIQSPYPPAEPTPPGAPFGSDPYAPPPAAPPATFSGAAIAGFILAIVIPPIGFILSIVGVILASRPGRKGKGLAIAGIIISLLLSGGVVAIVVKLANSNISTVADPGCITGKAAITENVDVSDPAAARKSIETTVAGLREAASQAKHDNVRDAMTVLADDYEELLTGMDTGDMASDIQSRMVTHGEAIDKLCTIGA